MTLTFKDICLAVIAAALILIWLFGIDITS
jgi:hypothetical protein